jgi:hypothetical protein
LAALGGILEGGVEGGVEVVVEALFDWAAAGRASLVVGILQRRTPTNGRGPLTNDV